MLMSALLLFLLFIAVASLTRKNDKAPKGLAGFLRAFSSICKR